MSKKKKNSSRPQAACGIRYLQYSRKKVKKDRNKKLIGKKNGKKEKQTTSAQSAHKKRYRKFIFWIL
jgi:hypothetical protein